MLTIDGLSRRYGAKTAVDALSLEIRPGSFVGVIGRSGAGKSTLLRMINGLEMPSGGRILWNGQVVSGLQGRAMRDWRARCAMVFQHFNLAPRLDVLTGRLNKVSLPRALFGLWPEEDRAMALAALEQFDIADLAAQRAGQLSGGQQQRVAIARALVQEPEIILADEPIASLDPRNTQIVMDTLQHINRGYGITVLCNLHSLDVARRYCDRLVGLAGGKLVFDGGPQELGEAEARRLYGLEAAEVMGGTEPAPASPALGTPVPPQTVARTYA